jgi:AcrR family transcriptional regulator
MQARILDAALRVLHEEGALGFTTTRVADEAGVSVGSLYQYFPNKHALVIAIHREAVRRGWDHVRGILESPRLTARQKVVDIAMWFFATESAEAAQLGAVFDDIEVFLHKEHDEHDDALLEHEVLDCFIRFLSASRGGHPSRDTAFDAQLLMTTLEAVGKAITARPLDGADRQGWAVATATMLCDHLGISDP